MKASTPGIDHAKISSFAGASLCWLAEHIQIIEAQIKQVEDLLTSCCYSTVVRKHKNKT
ncbi:hypothetical protein [Citrobacter portucalensis]|uniref:hypothetical protein n=1 Tax=Citrobacter portucalensis TaxID=1639133 RepID=UPI002244B344|nr:hypothetical protein [Citrobacter portucalensis]MCW8353262.1 hypothetical protein [Citrobacter portucalensis]MCX8994356.1 hypothetical protein [Citrobacter portucalensis]MCX9017310.1 hypothetical protein [Citrobacter portucalensis]MCX9054211.1 hypothetical protein [Citrobacter portucalensis]MCX9059026.1 hypothetical protein [Citrobacter portucalensis]